MVYWSVFISSFLAATVIPFSSEIGLASALYAGYDALLLLICASTGNWLGGMTNYFLGRLGDWKKISRFTGIHREKTQKIELWVRKYGIYTAFFTWLPIVGDPLALILGIFHSDIWKTSLYMFIGKSLRYIAIYIVMDSLH